MNSPLFANTLFVPEAGSKPVLRYVGPDDEPRKKKAHKKSRGGCVQCKRRKVKCDETFPCRNCAKRNEDCSPTNSTQARAVVKATPNSGRPLSPPPSPSSSPRRFVAGRADGPITLRHLELFHHFSTITIHTLSFRDFWPEMISRAFHSEYIMTALLSTAATHLTALSQTTTHTLPAPTPHAHTALALRSRALSLFRTELARPLTPSSLEPLLGTSILIHYMTWHDLSFLEHQDTAGARPDLSRDPLLLLSPGLGHILSAVRQGGPRPNGFFGCGTGGKTACGSLGGAGDEAGAPGMAACIARAFEDMPGMSYDDDDDDDKKQRQQPLSSSAASSTHAAAHDEGAPSPSPSPSARAAGIAPLTHRVAALLALLLEHRNRNRNRQRHGRDDSRHHPSSPPESRRPGIERDLLALPVLLCRGAFGARLRAGDARALALLFHAYHVAAEGAAAGGVVVVDDDVPLFADARPGPADTAWWLRRRAVVMRRVVREELRARGWAACPRHGVEGLGL